MHSCPRCQSVKISKKGAFRRKLGLRRKISRFLCKGCGRTFSDQTDSLTTGERKPEIDQPLYRLLNSGVSQRRAALIFGIHRTTVARKLLRLGRQAARVNDNARRTGRKAVAVVFDEMETFEHSKLKPLAIALAVEEGTRRVLSVKVASMPAKGRLAAASRRRYGRRRDGRAQALRDLLKEVRIAAPYPRIIKSDQCPRYPSQVARAFPGVRHDAFLSRRACVVGQGELKAGGFDPLFSLNHTCAMFRDNLKRLSRRTWCTTKRPQPLSHLTEMYAAYHNARLTHPKRPPELPERTWE